MSEVPMTLGLAMWLLTVASTQLHLDPADWSNLSAADQDELRAAADRAGVVLHIHPLMVA